MSTRNVPRLVAAVVPRFASLRELATDYSMEDVYDMIEIAAVDAHNHNERVRHDTARQAAR